MYIVGIDIGKNHHEASIVSPEGKQIGRSLRFATTHKGADSLMSFIFKNIGNSSCVSWHGSYRSLLVSHLFISKSKRIYHLCNQSYPV
ncbi:MAG: IS110 family transposase [Agathobacter rectalis]